MPHVTDVNACKELDEVIFAKRTKTVYERVGDDPLSYPMMLINIGEWRNVEGMAKASLFVYHMAIRSGRNRRTDFWLKSAIYTYKAIMANTQALRDTYKELKNATGLDGLLNRVHLNN